jgi:penicillin amidase
LLSHKVPGISRRTAKFVACIVTLVILLPLAVVYAVLRASLPTLDGTIAAPTLGAATVIERDVLGIPTITAANRADLAFGTGFVHGQDRFFQMDLLRRVAAGELAELFGAAAVQQDEKARTFRFRHIATEVLGELTADQRALLSSYARGVNAALVSVHSRPWEYWVLGPAPAPWREEDTILITLAMWWDLQYGAFESELAKREINDKLSGPECAPGWKCALQFFYPSRTGWDSPNGVTPGTSDSTSALASLGGPSTPQELSAPAGHAGSNNWALSGRLTATGAALVASDMHLNLRVPTVWYRARLRTTSIAGAAGLDLNGVTLPGAPLLVAGSNGHVAWAFTNSGGKWLDLHSVECEAIGDAELRTSHGAVPLSVDHELIRVHGADTVSFEVKSASEGVLFLPEPTQGHCWFARWLAQLPGATNLNLQKLETARTVNEVLKLAPDIGIPEQNLVVGDRGGHIAWTICGRIPADSGAQRLSGQGPWTSPAQHPHLVDPPSGRLWTANARAIDDAHDEALIGGDEASIGADYDLGARARQIGDDLAALAPGATPADMLRVQLDDRAFFLTPWRNLILELLDENALRNHPRRAAFKRLIFDWNARASIDSVGYRLVREVHDQTESALWRMSVGSLGMTEQVRPPDRFEKSLWALVTARPPGKLPQEFASWRELLLAQIDIAIVKLTESCGELATCTWGARNLVRVRHPLSGALSYLARFLDMPAFQSPGDHNMPRVQDVHEGAFGASERFAVSPGFEAQGYLHIAGGQSGHPLSPYYRAGFEAWARGEPLPFLPGSVQHRLLLSP